MTFSQNAQPRRHPDFTKEPNQQPYQPYGGQRPQMYGMYPQYFFLREEIQFILSLGAWPPNATSGGQFRPQYPPQAGPQPWGQSPRPGQPQGANQWDQNRYPVNSQYGPVS